MTTLRGCLVRSGVVLLIVSLAACAPGRRGDEDPDGGDGSGGDGGGGLTGVLTVRPAELSVTAGPGQPAGSARFTAVTRGGVDVTASGQWMLEDPGLGAISAGTFTAAAGLSRGGASKVYVRKDDAVGTALLKVKYIAADLVDTTAPAGATGVFTGAAGGPAPTVVYPLSGVMFARNIRQVQLAWRPGSGQKIFRLVVDSPTYQRSIYLGCSAAQCTYDFKDADWDQIATSSAGAQVSLTLAGTAGAGQPVGVSSPVNVSYSPEDVRGGLYYFSTSARGLFRLPFGGTKAMPFTTSSGCVGCHGVSPDGKKVAAVFNSGDGAGGIVDGSDGTKVIMRPKSAVWNFASFNPDGTKLATVWRGQLAIRDGTTGDVIQNVPQDLVGGRVSMPEWSPDGKSIVFVRVASPEGKIGYDLGLGAGDWLLADAGDIVVLPYNAGTLGTPVTVVPRQPGVEYHFYPSFSPDSQWLVFNSARKDACFSPTADNNGVNTQGMCATYDQRAARLRLVRAQASAVPIELTAATRSLNHTTAWPKFAPFQQNGGKLVFFTFSSKHDYGFAVPIDTRPQIWMSAIDLDKAQKGSGDPSYTPFWLPFQNAATNNHEVIWTKEIACTKPGDCGAEFDCVNGTCVPKLGLRDAPQSR